jgi:hypothetical protein
LDLGETTLGNPGQVRPLWKELTDQAVGVFVRAALPRTVRIRKMDHQQNLWVKTELVSAVDVRFLRYDRANE